MSSFLEKWLEAVERKNSVLCGGLDPAEHGMGRGEKGLPEGTNKRDWAIKYLKAIAPHCAAIKPNIQYWKKHGNIEKLERGDMENLVELTSIAQELGLVVIEDSKLADIGSTNDSGVYHARDKGMYAVTFSPFAGNMREAAQQAHDREIGLISMCLMSNPESAREKNKLVFLEKEEYNEYETDQIIKTDRGFYTRQYQQLAHDANKFGVDGIVIGAPSKKNHIRDDEIYFIRRNVGDNMLVLCPGIGAQGGEATALWKYFDKNNVIVNVGRAMMLPKGSYSTPKQQAETARQYKEMLNKLRTSA